MTVSTIGDQIQPNQLSFYTSTEAKLLVTIYQWARLLISIIHYCMFEHSKILPTILHSYIHQMNTVLCRSLRSVLFMHLIIKTLFGEWGRNIEDNEYRVTLQTKLSIVHGNYRTKNRLLIRKCVSVCSCQPGSHFWLNIQILHSMLLLQASDRQGSRVSGRISYWWDKYQAISFAHWNN